MHTTGLFQGRGETCFLYTREAIRVITDLLSNDPYARSFGSGFLPRPGVCQVLHYHEFVTYTEADVYFPRWRGDQEV